MGTPHNVPFLYNTMPCYHPLDGYFAKLKNPSGKRSVVFNLRDAYSDMPVQVPCGQCIGCRLERSRQWAIRCLNEASLHEDNAFITLTFNEQHKPSDGSLYKPDFQKFMKRLRKHFPNKKIRYFHCGEYGEKLSRPHHHACLFNIDFPDKILFSDRNNINLYTSKILTKIWPFGFSTIGEVNFETAAYCARYITKKITGDIAEGHYAGRIPEYVTMSRRPGIGHNWFKKYQRDVFPHDYMIIRNGIKTKPPKYYDYIYSLTNPEEFAKLKYIRERAAQKSEHNTPERLDVREAVTKSRTSNNQRTYENGKNNFQPT